MSNEPRGNGKLGFVSGIAGETPVAWRAALSVCARTSRTGLAGVVPLSGDVVDALENACKELPEIMGRILLLIHYG